MYPGSTRLGPDLTHAIELHLRNCELARNQRNRTSGPEPRVQPFVAISRQFGAGGSEIGQELARRLEWPLFDREILHAMSGNNDVRERLYQWMDERDTNWLEQMLESLQFGRHPPQDYFPKLCNTILVLARAGPGIFLGRAADLILPAECGLRLRVVAPFEQRVKRYSERNHVEEVAARAEVARIDRDRSEFIRRHFQRDCNDPLRSGLTINTSQITLDEAVEMVLGLLRTRRMVAADLDCS